MADLRISLKELEGKIGEELGVSEWFEITQERVDAFADCTLDRNWIHVDVEKATKGPFKSTIVHGALLLSLIYHLSNNLRVIPMGISLDMNYGFDKVRFLNPVKVGSRVRMRVVVADFSDKGKGRYLLKVSNTFEVEGEDKPACIAEALAMFAK